MGSKTYEGLLTWPWENFLKDWGRHWGKGWHRRGVDNTQKGRQGGTEGRARRLIVNTRQHVSEWVCRSDAGSFDQCLVRTWCADLELDEGDGEGELAAALESREIVDESWVAPAGVYHGMRIGGLDG